MVRYQVLGWVCTLSMITYIDRVCYKQAGSELRTVLGVTSDQLAWAFSAFGLAYALFEVPGGWLGDRLGPRKVLTRIVLCWSLFTALTGSVWDIGYDLSLPLLGAVPAGLILLIAIRFLFGVGEAGAYPNIARAMRNWFPYGRRGVTQGMPWAFGRWGGAFAPLLFGSLAAWLGWRGAFWAFGIVGALWVICFAIWFRNTPAEHPAVNDAERELIMGDAGPGADKLKPPLSWRSMLRSRSLWCLCWMYFCSNAGWCFFITWDVEYYRTVLGLSGTTLEIAAGAPLFFGGIACLLGGFLTDALVKVLGRRWGRTLQGLISYSLGGLFFFLALLTTNPLLALSALCVASFMKDFGMASSWSTCVDIGHRYSGTVSGFMNMVGNLGTFVSPPIVAYLAKHGFMSSRGGWQLALVYSACMFFAASVGWAFINPKRVIVYSPQDRQRLLQEGTIV
jgi:MFS transporter, ACS family, glucarate transporter